MHGTVVRVVVDRGFGFIKGDDGQEYFFHRNALHSTPWEDLVPGTEVLFLRGEDPGDQPGESPRAVSVTMAPGELPPVDTSSELAT